MNESILGSNPEEIIDAINGRARANFTIYDWLKGLKLFSCFRNDHDVLRTLQYA